MSKNVCATTSYKKPKRCPFCKYKKFRINLAKNYLSLQMKSKLTYCCLRCRGYITIFPKPKPIKFNKYYSKLDNDEFKTLRKMDHEYFMGFEYPIQIGKTQIGIAKLGDLKKRNLNEISDEELIQDTDTSNRSEAIHELNRIYPNLTEFQQLSFKMIQRNKYKI